MKKWSILAAMFGVCLALPSLAQAQSYDHGEVGVFADYFRFDRTTPDINFVGVGGRVSFNVNPNVALEAEMAYDFKRNFTNTFSDGITTTFVPSNTRPLHALFGPKFQVGSSSPVRAFVTGKVGLVSFSTSSASPGAGFKSAIAGVSNGDALFAVYPGAGVEGFIGPIGLRLDVGDEIYFDNGARNNLRVTFGPHIRF